MTNFVLKINGLSYLIHNKILLSDLLYFLNIDQNGIALEYNRTIITKPKYSSIFLKDMDKIEIVSIVGGG